MGAPLAFRRGLEGAQGRVISLASTSPQRRAILEQLGIPFEVVTPAYDERSRPEASPVEHACAKARSVSGELVLGVDTTVQLDGESLGKPADAAEARSMLGRLAGRTHEVISGLCLVAPGWEESLEATTRVTFRSLGESELDAYVATGEWEGRAGAYAIQGRGSALVERIEGDYLNVVGLPAAALLSVLERRFPGGGALR
jgi:septum formation protein